MADEKLDNLHSNFVIINGKKREIYRHKLTITRRELKSIKDIELLDNCAEVTSLTINKCKLESMEGLNFFPKLESLDLSDNCLQNITNLNHTPILKHLHLSSNNIHKIENLDGCLNLLTVDLSRNKISEIENLDSLSHLEELDLQINQIKEIKNLEKLRNLKFLYLTGNKNITLITNLDQNTLLEQLFLSYCGLREISGLNHLIHLKDLRVSLKSTDFEIQGLDHLINLNRINLDVMGLKTFHLPEPIFIKMLRFACILKNESYFISDWKDLYLEFPLLFHQFVFNNSYHKINWYLSECRNIAKILPQYKSDLEKMNLDVVTKDKWTKLIKRIDLFLKEKPLIVSIKEIHKEDIAVQNEVFD